jgi:hypothetical protein
MSTPTKNAAAAVAELCHSHNVSHCECDIDLHMSTMISMTSARLDDPASMSDFLRPIPNGDRLAAVLARGAAFSSRAYDDDAETARFVASDGVVVKCFAVSEITIDQAEMIAFVGTDLAELEEPGFRDLVVQALGSTFDPPPGV